MADPPWDIHMEVSSCQIVGVVVVVVVLLLLVLLLLLLRPLLSRPLLSRKKSFNVIVNVIYCISIGMF